MRHATPAALEKLEGVLKEIRKHEELQEKRRGVFTIRGAHSCTFTKTRQVCSLTLGLLTTTSSASLSIRLLSGMRL